MKFSCVFAEKISGGMTGSKFPRVAAILKSDPALLLHLEACATEEDKRFFQSAVDFMFCTVFPIFLAACKHAYQGDAKAFRDRVTRSMEGEFERILLRALHVLALAGGEGRVRKDWLSETIIRDIPRPRPY